MSRQPRQPKPSISSGVFSNWPRPSTSAATTATAPSATSFPKRSTIWARSPPAKPDVRKLADRVHAAIFANDYGQFDGVIGLMAPALGGEGLAMLKTRLEAESTTPPKASDRKVIAITTRGPIQREDFEARYKARRIQSALTDIADALGDADGYAARYSDEERSNPAIAAQIAERLLRADRPDDAMATLELASHRPVVAAIGPIGTGSG
jgi:hypothetical protein